MQRGVSACILLLLLISNQAHAWGWKKKAKSRYEGEDVKGSCSVDDTCDSGTLAALDAEIEALERLIKQQHHKVKALKQLRQQYLATADSLSEASSTSILSLPVPFTHTQASQSAAAKRHESTNVVYPVGEIRSSGDAAASSYPYASPSYIARHQDYLIKRTTIKTETNATASHVLTFQMVKDDMKRISRGPPIYKLVNLVAIAHGEVGKLLVYDLEGNIMADYDTEHKAPITTIAFEGREDPLLVTVASDGSVHLHMVSLWRNEVMVAGRQPYISHSAIQEHHQNIASVDSKLIKPPQIKTREGYGIRLIFEKEMEQPSHEGRGKDNRVLSALVYKHRLHNCVVMTGNLDGTIVFNARNGSLIKALYTDFPVYAMEKSGTMIAHSHHSDVYFLGAVGMQPTQTRCSGKHSPVRSLAFDVNVPGMLYAGTMDGDILLFDTREKLPEDKLHYFFIRKISAPQPGSPVALATVRGYLLAASESNLIAYNVSGLRESSASPFSQMFQFPFPMPALPSLFAASFAKINSRIPPCIVLPFFSPMATLAPTDKKHKRRQQQQGMQFIVFESLLPYHRSRPIDLTWLRGPMLIAGLILLVYVVQQRKGSIKKKRETFMFDKMDHFLTARRAGGGRRHRFDRGSSNHSDSGFVRKGSHSTDFRGTLLGRESIQEEEEEDEEVLAQNEYDLLRSSIETLRQKKIRKQTQEKATSFIQSLALGERSTEGDELDELFS